MVPDDEIKKSSFSFNIYQTLYVQSNTLADASTTISGFNSSNKRRQGTDVRLYRNQRYGSW